MSIVKIHLYRSPTEKQEKYLLTYLPEIHSTIAHFIQFAIKALDIEHCTQDDLIVENDGYILPHCLDGSVIKQMQLLTLKVKSQRKMPTTFWTAQKIDEPQENHEPIFAQNIIDKIDEEHLDQSESTPKFSEDGIGKPISSRKNSKESPSQAKLPKPAKKQSKKKKKIIQQENQSQESEQKPIKKTKKLPKLKQKSKNISFSKSESSQELEQDLQKSSEESSQESSEEELPRVNRSKKVQVQQKIQQKKVDQKKIPKKTIKPQSESQESSESDEPYSKKKLPQKKPVPNIPVKVIKVDNENISQMINQQQNKFQKEVYSKTVQSKVTYEQRKKIIEADDIESSDSSSEEDQTPVKKVVAEQKSPKTAQNPQPKMLPPALRNKVDQHKSPATGTFKKQQEQKWIPITKEIIQKYKKTYQQNCPPDTPFSQANNLIRFKEIELDEERFVPKTSEWIDATVERVESDGKLRLIKVTQVGREYRDRYETYEHNMVEFQVNKDLLTKEQREVALGSDQGQKQPQVTQQPQAQQTPEKQQKSNSEGKQSDKNSIERFICCQVNYYFCDKNYPFDLFMQMHANKHPQKCNFQSNQDIPIRFLLNFPKIKKVLKDQSKLLQYLVEDERRNDRNFEIDEDKRLIRKKNVQNNQKNQEKVVIQAENQPQDQNQN